MKKTKWTIRRTCGADYALIGRSFGVSPVCARVILNRQVASAEEFRKYLYGTFDDLSDPSMLRNAPEAAALLKKLVREGRKIRIIGDYDVDGVCATAILYETLRKAGADVDYEIPDRIADGYGMNERLVTDAVRDGVEVLLTCDNGISAHNEIQKARDAGITVIVTDHHLPSGCDPEAEDNMLRLPPADIIVDPSVPGETYPYPGMCGAVVAWKVMQLMTGRSLEAFLPLAALATDCDVMELTGENRIIVRCGLEKMRRLRKGGLYALIRACGLVPEQLTGYDLGFRIGPCLNASGRLDTAHTCISLLFAGEQTEAEKLAAELVALNDQRRAMTEDGTRQAFAALASSGMTRDKVFVIYLPGCHQSLAGIIAGRIREAYARPSIVFTDSIEPGILKGSGRSVEGYHMFRALSRCSELLLKFGGHPMAAGMTLKAEQLDAFREKLNSQCTLEDEDLCDRIRIDMEIPFSDISLSTAEELQRLEPFGKGNEKPVFATRHVLLRDAKILGAMRNAFRCNAVDADGTRRTVMWFGDTEMLRDSLREKFAPEAADAFLSGTRGLRATMLYQPRINEYNGSRYLQLLILDLGPER